MLLDKSTHTTASDIEDPNNNPSVDQERVALDDDCAKKELSWLSEALEK
jgi:hypothetical protein